MIYAVFVFLLGLILGSFYLCFAFRVPNKISIVKPDSYCPHCKKSLTWYMNIPVISYIFLKGKCAYCHKKIGIIYPLAELTCGLFFLINYLLFGFTYTFFVSSIVFSALFITAITDFKYYYISDRVIFVSYILILILKLVYFGINDIYIDILSSIVMFIIMYLIKLLGNMLYKKESLGDGDIKLMLMVGLTLSIKLSIVVLFISSIITLVFSPLLIKKSKQLPFGPFILISLLIVFYFLDYFNLLLGKLNILTLCVM